MIESGVELREIRTFLVLAEELHFGRTAERLRVTPSRVSQTIRTLERRVGGRLFDRTSRSVRLTPVGEQFCAAVAQPFADHDVSDAPAFPRGHAAEHRHRQPGPPDRAVIPRVPRPSSRHKRADLRPAGLGDSARLAHR
jgi:DNA-binding transcriptional LysR family regulator